MFCLTNVVMRLSCAFKGKHSAWHIRLQTVVVVFRGVKLSLGYAYFGLLCSKHQIPSAVLFSELCSYVPVVGKFLSSFLMLNNEVLLAATMTVSVARLCIIKVARIRVGEFLTTKYNREYEECDCVCSKVKSMPCNFAVHNYSRIKIWYYSCLCRLLWTWEVFGHFSN